jgi:polysaccharide deacetylase family protein (PEP-CTERM system associated)
MDLVNAFTVDVEDYFQVSAFEKDIARDQWSQYTSRVVANTHRILDLLACHDVKATFFVLGWVAKRFPQLLRDIHGAGHEIGCHSHEHRLIYNQTPDQFRDDLRRSLGAIQDACEAPITAYRAPSFSITRQSLWALEILAEEGFLIDSSIFPTHHGRYGIPDAEPRFHRINTSAGPLWEFPPSVVRFCRLNLPVSGGGYFRLYPLSWTVHCLRKINRTKQPFVFYIHPWEVDPDQPKLKAGSRLSQLRHHVNLSRTYEKLERLLTRFRFGTLSTAAAGVGFPVPESKCPRILGQVTGN